MILRLVNKEGTNFRVLPKDLESHTSSLRNPKYGPRSTRQSKDRNIRLKGVHIRN